MPLPEARKGADVRVFAARAIAAGRLANDRLKADAKFYQQVRKEFGE